MRSGVKAYRYRLQNREGMINLSIALMATFDILHESYKYFR